MLHQAGDQFLFTLTEDVVEIAWVEMRWNVQGQPDPFYHLETLPNLSTYLLGKKQKKHRYTMSGQSLSRFFSKIPNTLQIDTDMFLPLEEEEPF